MNILEIKNNLVKVLYEEELKLASFVKIKDLKTYIAQVLHIEATKKGKIAIAKIVFNFTTTIKAYDGSIPSIQSEVELLDDNFFLKFFDKTDSIALGTINGEENVIVSSSFLKDKPVVFAEKSYQSNEIIENIIKQNDLKSKKTIVIDVNGELSGNKLIATDNFKIPLDKYSIDYIFDRGFENVTPENKAFFQDVFSELNDYIKTVEYIPFRTFVNVVDDEYKQSGQLQLIILRNRLVGFERDGIFAQEKAEFRSLKESLCKNNTTIVDISRLSESLQTEYIEYIYSVASKQDTELYSIVSLNNENSSKEMLNKILSSGNVYTTFICPYTYKYTDILKKCSKNMLMYTPIKQQNDFGAYNVYLNKLAENEFVLYGKTTKFVPIIVNSKINVIENVEPIVPNIEEVVENNIISNDIVESSQTEQSEAVQSDENNTVINSINLQTVVEENTQDSIIAEIQEKQEETAIEQKETSVEEEIVSIQEESEKLLEENNEQVELQSDENLEEAQNEAIKVEQSNDVMNIVVEPITDSNLEEMASLVQAELSGISIDISDNEIPAMAKADISAFDEYRMSEQIDNSSEITEDTLTNDELDLIEELNSDEQLESNENVQQEEIAEEQEQVQEQAEVQEEIQEEVVEQIKEEAPIDEKVKIEVEDQYQEVQNVEPSITDQILKEDEERKRQEEASRPDPIEEQIEKPNPEKMETRPGATPIVPIYNAEVPDEDIVDSDDIKQGDVVYHEEFGNGIVEKIINYGDRKLCSINFEGEGRKLLDPKVSEIKKA